MVFRVVQSAIGPNLQNIGQTLLHGLVLLSLQLHSHCLQVHRVFHDVWIVHQLKLLVVDGLTKINTETVTGECGENFFQALLTLRSNGVL